MAVVLGTSAGFVTTTPTSDPSGTASIGWDGYISAFRYTSPAGTNAVDRIIWWQDYNIYVSCVWQAAIYSNDAAPDPDKPNVVLSPGIYTDFNCGPSIVGWQIGGVNIPLTATTLYWIGLGIPVVTGNINFDYTLAAGGDLNCYTADAAGTLDATWGTVDVTNSDGSLFAIAARYMSLGSADLSGTATATITESDIVSGGKTIIVTLTNDTFIP